MSDPDALTRYRQAKANLQANQLREEANGIDYETDEYLRLNHEVNEAARHVSWWRR